MSDEESSDEDYDFHATGNDLQGEDVEARFPIHDCCEFEDVEALKVRSCIAGADPEYCNHHGELVCLSSVNPYPSRRFSLCSFNKKIKGFAIHSNR